MARMTLILHVLGPPRFVRGGATVPLTQAKAVALLVYLAVTRSPQRRERLIDLLWPESLAAAARKNMRNTLWTIGEALGQEVIEQAGGSLSLASSVIVDAHALEDSVLLLQSGDLAGLERGAAQYRGPLADGLALHEAPEFELWLQTERERFADLTLRLLAQLIAHHQRARRWESVIDASQRALTIDPLREPVHLALIEAALRLGQRGQASQQYVILTETLRRELGVEPLPETRMRYEALLASATAAPPARMAAARAAEDAAELPPDPAFVGRTAELAALDAELSRAARGEARVVLISGELGIGKSALWRHWLATRAAGATALIAEALETSEPTPFSPLLGLFRSDRRVRGLLDPSSPLPQVWLAELARLLPELSAAWPGLPPPLAVPPAEERGRIFQALVEALRLLADPLLVLVIDDLHWADPSTLDWLTHLLSQLRRAPLLLLATLRPQDAPERLTTLVASWQRHGLVRQLALPLLSADEADALMAALGVSGEHATRAALLHQSGGNPFFLIELSRAGSPEHGRDLAALVRARLRATTGAMVAQVLQAAALLGTDATFGTLQAASGRSEEETLDALDTLLRAGVLVEQGAGYRFVHPLVAAVVAGDLSHARRQFLHRRVARAIEHAAGELAPVAARLAGHLIAAGETGRAAHYAELAARHALALTGWVEATAHARQALLWEPTPERALLVGELLELGGVEDGRDALEQARAGFARDADALGEARACLQLALRSFGRGQLAEAQMWLAQGPFEAAQREAPGVGVEASLLASAIARQRGDPAAAEQFVQRAVEVALASRLPHLAAMPAFERGNLLADRGDLDGARLAFEDALASARATDNLVLETIVLNSLAFRAIRAGELDEAGRWLAEAQARAERGALGFVRQYLWSTTGELALARGQLDAADAAFAQAYEAALALGNRAHQANVRLNQAEVALARGERARALELVVAAHERFGQAADQFLRGRLRRAAEAVGMPAPPA